ncbi:hypothetical protein EDD38_4212 [Kitasatospora cineracea]|uniref:Lipoprotein n=2 Tax=Kitasatospora cineracea TaxID=88074 RepID=A0A3N4RYT8_9ACTN|nr:hypothetical protein EDD38_4212 [Kitasatospora cineracea]
MHGIRMRTAVAGAAAAAALAAGCGSGSGGSGSTGSPAASGTGSPVSASAAAASAAADNGVAGQSADQVLQRAVQALKDAGAVRAAGTVGSEGGQITMDLRLDTTGDCTGTLSQGGVGSFQVVKSGQQLWVKPDQEFWQTHGGPAMAQLVGDRYLKTTSDNPDFGEIGSLCDLTALADQLGTGKSGLAKGGEENVQGRPALTLTNTSGTGTGTLYVATTGEPVPLKLAKDTGAVEFSDFGTPVPSATPGPDQSLDLDQLQQPSSSTSVV